MSEQRKSRKSPGRGGRRRAACGRGTPLRTAVVRRAARHNVQPPHIVLLSVVPGKLSAGESVFTSRDGVVLWFVGENRIEGHQGNKYRNQRRDQTDTRT